MKSLWKLTSQSLRKYLGLGFRSQISNRVHITWRLEVRTLLQPLLHQFWPNFIAVQHQITYATHHFNTTFSTMHIWLKSLNKQQTEWWCHHQRKCQKRWSRTWLKYIILGNITKPFLRLWDSWHSREPSQEWQAFQKSFKCTMMTHPGSHIRARDNIQGTAGLCLLNWDQYSCLLC